MTVCDAVSVGVLLVSAVCLLVAGRILERVELVDVSADDVLVVSDDKLASVLLSKVSVCMNVLADVGGSVGDEIVDVSPLLAVSCVTVLAFP